MARVKVAALALMVIGCLARPASAGPVSMWDFTVFSAGGAAFNAQSNPETRLGVDVIVNGLVGSNQDMLMVGGATVVASGVYVGGYLDMGTEARIGNSTTMAEVVVNGVNPEVGSPGVFEAQINGDIYGNLFVTGDVQLQSYADIRKVGGVGGNVEYTGTYDTNGSPTVEGTVSLVGSTQQFSLITIPGATNFDANVGTLVTDDRSCTGACTSLVLAPGSYRDLDIGSSKSLYLTAGDYYFNTINVNSDLMLYLDVTGGPINIYVLGIANFGSNQTSMVKGTGTGGNYVLLSAAPDLAAYIYLETKNKFNVNSGTQWAGTVFASQFEANGADETYVGQNITWWGAIYAFDSLDIHQGSTVNYVRSYLAPNGPTAVPEPSSLLLLGGGLLAVGRVVRRRKRN